MAGILGAGMRYGAAAPVLARPVTNAEADIKTDVFISFRGGDGGPGSGRQAASLVCAALSDSVIRPFMSNEVLLAGGTPFHGAINSALSSCAVGVVILSADYFSSAWCCYELQVLLQRKGIPVVVVECGCELRSVAKVCLPAHNDERLMEEWFPSKQLPTKLVTKLRKRSTVVTWPGNVVDDDALAVVCSPIRRLYLRAMRREVQRDAVERALRDAAHEALLALVVGAALPDPPAGNILACVGLQVTVQMLQVANTLVDVRVTSSWRVCGIGSDVTLSGAVDRAVASALEWLQRRGWLGERESE